MGNAVERQVGRGTGKFSSEHAAALRTQPVCWELRLVLCCSAAGWQHFCSDSRVWEINCSKVCLFFERDEMLLLIFFPAVIILFRAT